MSSMGDNTKSADVSISVDDQSSSSPPPKIATTASEPPPSKKSRAIEDQYDINKAEILKDSTTGFECFI
ncbi:hypothetical protein ACH5RR_031137 [Cinchona calisaya]|uniref:Uncharacterized protein n=1 Tax=Cinchona calisaya TaxID=153742 RepID=A0ABD2YHT8_9GENT